MKDTSEGQKSMLRTAQERTHTVCKVFNEIMSGPNPLTPAEVRSLIAKRPEVYGVLAKWNDK